MGEIVGVVYGWEMTLRGSPTGYVFIDDSLELAVASTHKHRDSVLKIAASSWLSCRRIGALRMTLARDSPDIDAIREVASAYSTECFEELPSFTQFFRCRPHMKRLKGRWDQERVSTFVNIVAIVKMRISVM